MKRWDVDQSQNVESPEVDAFLNDIIHVYHKHSMSLGHEDRHGAFEVYKDAPQEVIDWLKEAHICKWEQ